MAVKMAFFVLHQGKNYLVAFFVAIYFSFSHFFAFQLDSFLLLARE